MKTVYDIKLITWSKMAGENENATKFTYVYTVFYFSDDEKTILEELRKVIDIKNNGEKEETLYKDSTPLAMVLHIAEHTGSKIEQIDKKTFDNWLKESY